MLPDYQVHVFAFIGQLDTEPSFPILFDPQSTVSAAYGVKGLRDFYCKQKGAADTPCRWREGIRSSGG